MSQQRGNGRVFMRGHAPWIAFMHKGKEQRERALDIKTGRPTYDLGMAGKYLKKRSDQATTEKGGGPLLVTLKASKTTVGELCDMLTSHFEIQKKLSPQNRSNIARVKKDFGDYQATALTSELIDAYIQNRLAGYKDENGEAIPPARPASINRVTQLLGQAYRHGVQKKKFPATIIPHIERLSEADNVREDCLSEAQLAAVVERLPEHLQDFTRWCAACGMRKGEAGALSWSMINGQFLCVPGAVCKNGRDRILPLVGELAEILKRRKAAQRIEVQGEPVRFSEFIFHRNGQPVYEYGHIDFDEEWRAATKAANCPGHLFHGLRRFAATALLDAGNSPEIAAKWTGHRSTAMLYRYRLIKPDKQMTAGFELLEAYRNAERAKAQATVVPMAVAK